MATTRLVWETPATLCLVTITSRPASQGRTVEPGSLESCNARRCASSLRLAGKHRPLLCPRAVLMRAQHVYKIADEKKVVRGKNDKAIIASCIIFATRDAGANRTFQEVCKVLKVSKKELGQVFGLVKAAVQEEQVKEGRGVIGGLSNTQNSTEALLGRFCNYLDLGNIIYNAAKHIVVEASFKSAIDGRSPVSIAAGVLLFTCVLFEKSMTAKDIVRVADVSESTIKLICKMIAMKLDEVIRPEWRNEHPDGYANLATMSKINDASARPSRTNTARPAVEDMPEVA